MLELSLKAQVYLKPYFNESLFELRIYLVAFPQKIK